MSFVFYSLSIKGRSSHLHTVAPTSCMWENKNSFVALATVAIMNKSPEGVTLFSFLILSSNDIYRRTYLVNGNVAHLYTQIEKY